MDVNERQQEQDLMQALDRVVDGFVGLKDARYESNGRKRLTFMGSEADLGSGERVMAQVGRMKRCPSCDEWVFDRPFCSECGHEFGED